MAFRRVELALSLILVTAMAGQASAQLQSGCTTTLMNLSPCLNYITGNSSSPSPTCCTRLSNVVQSSPVCLCSVMNGAAASLGITVNRTLALSLPSACSVTTPPLSQCQAANAPTASDSPLADSPSETPDAALTPSDSDIPTLGGGSKSVPSAKNGGPSVGGSTKASINVALFVLFLLSYSSTIFTF